jgi:hypothetical protein
VSLRRCGCSAVVLDSGHCSQCGAPASIPGIPDPPNVFVSLPRTLVQRLAPGALTEAEHRAAHVHADERRALVADYVGGQVAIEIAELEADVLDNRDRR